MSIHQTSIPMLDLTHEIESLEAELNAAITRVLHSRRFILGPEVSAFEKEAAEYLGAKHAIGVGSGTDALVISLRALGIGPGDEVITSPFTFVATAEAICNVGAKPVFVDIDPETFNIDAGLIEAAITQRTRAILPVHLFGLAAEMDSILDIAHRHRLKVIEDTAQAFGGRYRERRLGTLGDAGAFSFFPSKNLGTYGDGGMLVTENDQVADTARKLRSHGGRNKYLAEMLGYNSRLDELHAAILRVKLPWIDRWNQQRLSVAQQYDRRLEGMTCVQRTSVPLDCQHVYHQYTVRIGDGKRDRLQQQLAEQGISSAVYYPAALHQFSTYRNTGQAELHYAEQACREVLSLPIGPSMQAETVETITTAVKQILEP